MVKLLIKSQWLTRHRFAKLVIGLCLLGNSFSMPVFAAGISPASKCNPLAVDTCALPFPSDVFRNLGGTYNYSDRILDRRTSGNVRTLLPARNQFPKGFLPSKVLNRSTGFSPLGPVLFELNNWPIEKLPEDGEGFLHVYDIDTGERVPMRVSLSEVAQPESGLREPRPVVIGWPRSRFDYGKRYVAILYKAGFNQMFGDPNGEFFSPSNGVSKALNNEAGWLLTPAYRPVLNFIDNQEIDRSDVLSFTWFTVKNESEVLQPMKNMVMAALDSPHFVAAFEETEPVGDPDYGAMTLKGLMSIVNFRGNDGGVYPPYEPVADLARTRVEFILELPKWNQATPVPMVVQGHGLGNFKELTRTGFRLNDRLGLATIAIDHPNHGSRVTLYDDFKEPHISTAASTPITIMHLLGMFVQGTIDQNVAIYAAKHIFPREFNRWKSDKDVNLPELDGSRVVYDGLSLGGMLGAAIGATAPELTGAYLVNGSGSLMQAFSESTFWPLTSNVIPANMNGAEMTFVMAMMQHYLDIADGNNFAHLYRDLPEGYSPRALGMHYTLGDGSFPNSASVATAELADLPLLKEVIEAEPNLRFGEAGRSTFENGFGLVQSGYGYQIADETLQSLEFLNLDDNLNTPEVDALNSLLGIDLQDMLGNNSILTSLQNTLGIEEFNNVSQVLDLVYAGDVEDFLTHFNRNNEAARHRAIEWRCDLLSLDTERCDIAKQIASKEAAEEIELVESLGDTDTSDPMNDVNRAIESGLDNINVSDGSGGAIDIFYLMFWLIALMPMVLLRYLRGHQL
ncbi:MAG: hypothetical protein MI976_06910 [Pseudomonadales bacterium]|nr:hypothetical protein [Pseudomonadales bacterium]